MPDHVDPLRTFIESSWRCCSFLSQLTYNLISRHCKDLVAERGIYNLRVMASTPIDITSSDDSDFDVNLDDYEDTDMFPVASSSSVANPRVLPAWASNLSSTSTSRGNAGQFQRAPSPRRASTSVERSSNDNHHQWADHNKYFVENGNMGYRTKRSGVENLRGPDMFGYDKFSSQQAPKRTLPFSLQPSASTSKSKNAMENAIKSQIHAVHRSSYQSGGPSLVNSKNQPKDFSRGTDDEVSIVHENGGSRILPPSLMNGRPGSSVQHVNSSDNAYRPGVAEEIAPGTDERLVYQAALQDLNQPKLEAELPDGLLSVSLLRHQKIALHWMVQKETASLHCLGGILADDQGLGKTISMIALIQMQRSLQSKSKVAEDPSNSKTEALNLDDDDDKVEKTGESDDLKMIPEVSTSVQGFHRRRPAAGTLVVCPASVVRQWARELDEKVADGAKLSVLIYHGGARTKDPFELAKYDVVVTTYSLVTNEVPKQPLVDEEDEQKNGERHGLSSVFSLNNKKRKNLVNPGKRGKKGKKGIDDASFDSDCGTLARVGWFRIILDEAQTIKNHRTQVARACCGLRAKRRWCLSGTPIQNAIDDLYSYFRFLKYDPYAIYKAFCNQIKIPISRNSAHGYKKLQAVLKTIMLRRTKGTFIDGQPIINLPPKTVRLTKVDFSPAERAFYSKLEADSRSQFKAYAAAGTVNQNYANILLMLLRLRQACDHPLLVKGYHSESVGEVSLDTAKKLPHSMLIKLLGLLETSMAICRVCRDPPEDGVVTKCGHVFCYQCVSEFLTGDDNTCPAIGCKEQVGSDIVFSKATLRSSISDEVDSNSSQNYERSLVAQSDYTSSKIKAAIEILLSHRELNSSMGCNGSSVRSESVYSDDVTVVKHTTKYSNSQPEGPIKTIIFSQWTSMLDLVELSLNQSCIQYRRLDGTMTLLARDRAVKDFNTDPEVTAMIMSLKAGNLGLNMVAACHVILLDLWWNPTTEDQAVDRAHRIGQTRPVTVSRLTIKDTVEDRILALQDEKRKMVSSAFGEDQSGGSATRLTVEDLRYLFMV